MIASEVDQEQHALVWIYLPDVPLLWPRQLYPMPPSFQPWKMKSKLKKVKKLMTKNMNLLIVWKKHISCNMANPTLRIRMHTAHCSLLLRVYSRRLSIKWTAFTRPFYFGCWKNGTTKISQQHSQQQNHGFAKKSLEKTLRFTFHLLLHSAFGKMK